MGAVWFPNRRFPCHRLHTSCVAYPASYWKSKVVLSQVKRPALETCHELPSKAEVKNMSTLPLILIDDAWLSEWTNFIVFGCGRSGNVTDKITVRVRWKFIVYIPWLVKERDWWDMDELRIFLNYGREALHYLEDVSVRSRIILKYI